MTDPIQAAVEAERARYLASLPPRPAPPRSLAAVFDELHEQMAEALAFRLGGPTPDTDDAFRFVGMSFEGMVRWLLLLRGERNWSTRPEMLWRGITTTDVTALLAGAGNRLLRQAYATYSGGLLRLAGRVSSRDFRDVKAIQLDGDMALKEVSQAGEFKAGAMTAAAETFPISTFGRVFGLSRAIFSEDDLGAFSDLASRLGRYAGEFVGGKLAAAVDANANLADGQALFSATHANLGTGGALSETTLGELLKLVRNQTGFAGERIAAVPRALVVPSALELAGRKLVTLLGNPAPLEVVVEPRLTSATAFYIAADPATVEGLSYTYGPGAEGPTVEVGRRPGFEGLAAKIRLDFGCGFLDHRGWAKNAGA